jgi:hypothetical protein
MKKIPVSRRQFLQGSVGAVAGAVTWKALGSLDDIPAFA